MLVIQLFAACARKLERLGQWSGAWDDPDSYTLNRMSQVREIGLRPYVGILGRTLPTDRVSSLLNRFNIYS